MAEVEVRAAHNVLEACAQTDSIQKVVFTSSVTAVLWRDEADNATPSCDVDERNWSDVNLCKKFKVPNYQLFFSVVFSLFIFTILQCPNKTNMWNY